MRISGRSGFTLIELLVVIAIIAILAVVVVLTLNPAQLLAQSRDANRVSDLATLNSAINLYSTDLSGSSGYSLGATSTTYLSVPSSATNCSTLGMASSAYPYHCSTSNNFRLASSSGWLPVNFSQISSGAPFGSVPVDPVNQTSSGLYYTYTTDASVYDVSAFPESQKYAKTALTEGGNDPVLFETGSGMATLPDAGRGLIAYWPLNEGGGATAATDWSGFAGQGGTWGGPASGTSGFYSSGKIWPWAGYFNGVSTAINFTGTPLTGITTFTVSAWMYPTSFGTQNAVITVGGAVSNNALSLLVIGGNKWDSNTWAGGDVVTSAATTIALNTWHLETVVSNGSTTYLYADGVQVASAATSYNFSGSSANYIGAWASAAGNGQFAGMISDVRIYDRALSAAEVQELYNIGK